MESCAQQLRDSPHRDTLKSLLLPSEERERGEGREVKGALRAREMGRGVTASWLRGVATLLPACKPYLKEGLEGERSAGRAKKQMNSSNGEWLLGGAGKSETQKLRAILFNQVRAEGVEGTGILEAIGRPGGERREAKDEKRGHAEEAGRKRKEGRGKSNGEKREAECGGKRGQDRERHEEKGCLTPCTASGG